MEKLNIRTTVQPSSKLSYTQWCQLLKVSSQWKDNAHKHNMYSNPWDNQDLQMNTFDRLINKLNELFK